jgi:7,8-dihydropterin-6-yl-methyl-4-(beta-D-ribofuranosyl)aminobenzene 5'-phosphate synthase
MRSTRLPLLLALASMWAPASYSATESKTVADRSPARISVLFDAFGMDATMTKDWGYAALIEIDGKRILFDTGSDPDILAKNVRAKGVDLTKLDFVILSHRHSDHIGGASLLRTVNPQVRIYAPKESFGVFGSDLPGSFYRKDEALPAKMRYYDGAPPQTLKFGSVFPGANIHLIDKTTEIAPKVTLIALVSDAPGTRELKELSLALDTPAGLVLIVGCSHPGIEAILAEASKINPHVHFIAGGLHLVVANDSVVEKISSALHDTYKVDYIAPGHCTGEPAFATLRKLFGDRYIYAGSGTTLSLGANPRLR